MTARQARLVRIAPIALLALGVEATAQPTWSADAFTAGTQHAPALVAAADALMASPLGQEIPSRLALRQRRGRRADPASHEWVQRFESRAQHEAWLAKRETSPAWSEFQRATAPLSTPLRTAVYRTLRRWNEADENHAYWATHTFEIYEAGDFVAAFAKLMASPLGQRFPGEVEVAAAVAGARDTMVIHAGYASREAREAWIAARSGSEDWASFLEESSWAADYLGASVSLDVQRWGPSGSGVAKLSSE